MTLVATVDVVSHTASRTHDAAVALLIAAFSAVALLLSLVAENDKKTFNTVRLFDILTTPLALFFCILWPDTRVSLVLRILRSCRILWRVRFIREDLRLLAIILTRICGPMATLLMLTFWFFAEVGERLFGGIGMDRDPQYPYPALNFNDFFSSAVCLFVLFTFYNTAIVSAVLRTTKNSFVVVYFGGFFFIAYQLLFLILVAVVLEAFMVLVGSEDGNKKDLLNRYGNDATREFGGQLRRSSIKDNPDMLATHVTLELVLAQLFEEEWQTRKTPQLTRSHTVGYVPPAPTFERTNTMK